MKTNNDKNDTSTIVCFYLTKYVYVCELVSLKFEFESSENEHFDSI